MSKILNSVLDGLDDTDTFRQDVETLVRVQHGETMDGREYFSLLSRLTSTYWLLFAELAGRLAEDGINRTQRYFMRFGFVHEELVSNETLRYFLSPEADKDPPHKYVYYADEWLEAIAKGDLTPCEVDELMAGGAVDLLNMDGKQAARTEAQSIRQMAKMVTGRQGQHCPLLADAFLRIAPNNPPLTKMFVHKQMVDVCHRIDPTVLERTHRGKRFLICPRVLIVPAHGKEGVCWQVWDRGGRGKTGGRLVVPTDAAKSARFTVLNAVGDYRWQHAKEVAMHYWMEEGLTGEFYDLFMRNKMRGDIRRFFLTQYLLWTGKEARGVPSLDKKMRQLFWRLVPFGDEIKNEIKDRGAFRKLCEDEQRKKEHEAAEQAAAQQERIKKGLPPLEGGNRGFPVTPEEVLNGQLCPVQDPDEEPANSGSRGGVGLPRFG